MVHRPLRLSGRIIGLDDESKTTHSIEATNLATGVAEPGWSIQLLPGNHLHPVSSQSLKFALLDEAALSIVN